MSKEIQVAIPDPIVSMIERVAMDPNLPIERLTALMDMQERMMNKVAEQTFNRVFAEAMSEMPNIPRSGQNSHTKQRYSTLDDLIIATRPVLSKYGLSLNWQTSASGNEYSVTAVVRHADGHSISTTLAGGRDSGKSMNTLQAGGSTETYLKRYTGFSILGLASGDEVEDDGRSADVKAITAEQLTLLSAKADEAGVATSKICLAAGVEALTSFPASQFDAAMKRLNKNLEAKVDA